MGKQEVEPAASPTGVGPRHDEDDYGEQSAQQVAARPAREPRPAAVSR